MRKAVSANFRWMPIASHGRVSSIGASGQHFDRQHRAIDIQLEVRLQTELGVGGTRAIPLEGGTGAPQHRTFLQDGDSVIFKGWCEAPGAARIGFGECRGTVLPALSAATSSG